MEMIQKVNYTYVFKTESVTVFKHQSKMPQYISFNCYSLQSRRRFKTFQQELRESKHNEFDNINDLYGLATKYGVRATAGHRPTIIGTVAF